jgi:hypothetical protein
MILGGKHQGLDREAGATRTTLDGLFRRAGVRRPDALALVDPPNRESFTDGAPRRLTYAEADRAISALAARLRRLGLQTDMVVAMQLPNTVESVIALLGVLRAGMIAVPLPLLWRQQEMVAALGRIGAKAIVTSSRIGSAAHAEIAMQVAAELFPIRYVCSFGHDLPDGVVPLDELFVPGQVDFVQPPARPGNAAAHVTTVSFDVGADGIIPVARNHMELIAGGLAAYLESGAALDTTILSAIPLGSFAGIALTVLPWLLSGGTLALHHAFDPDTFAAQCRTQDGGTLVLPGSALSPLTEAGHLGDQTKPIIALWRSPERLAGNAPWRGEAALVDVASFGEAGLLASRRGADGMPSPIPCGSIAAPRGAAGAITVVEALRTGAGMLALRGPMVPAHAFPPGAERGREPHLTVDALGFVDTGFACRLERDTNTLTITGPPGGLTTIGGYRFRQRDVDGQVASVDPDATIVALPDAYLDARLAGSAPDRAATAKKLHARGANPLFAGAFRPRGSANAA